MNTVTPKMVKEKREELGLSCKQLSELVNGKIHFARIGKIEKINSSVCLSSELDELTTLYEAMNELKQTVSVVKKRFWEVKKGDFLYNPTTKEEMEVWKSEPESYKDCYVIETADNWWGMSELKDLGFSDGQFVFIKSESLEIQTKPETTGLKFWELNEGDTIISTYGCELDVYDAETEGYEGSLVICVVSEDDHWMGYDTLKQLGFTDENGNFTLKAHKPESEPFKVSHTMSKLSSLEVGQTLVASDGAKRAIEEININDADRFFITFKACDYWMSLRDFIGSDFVNLQIQYEPKKVSQKVVIEDLNEEYEIVIENGVPGLKKVTESTKVTWRRLRPNNVVKGRDSNYTVVRIEDDHYDGDYPVCFGNKEWFDFSVMQELGICDENKLFEVVK